MTTDPLRDHLQAALSGAFVLGPELGGGAMSRVFVATEAGLDREVVLKVLPADHVTDDVAERFRREILLGARLRHRHILPVYSAGRAAEYLYYTMPLISGESLRARLLRERALPLEMTLRILREVASALAYAHSQGIVHRDVKPENIFLEEAGVDRALLADFGIARVLGAASELTLTGTAIGTPLYMSPEQVDGRDVDGRSDIYSLGLVAWEMLAGRRPWAGETIYAIIYSQRYDHLPSINRFRSDVPRRVQRAIDRALAKDRDLRWPTVEAFAAALAEPVRPAARRSLGTGRRDSAPIPTAALPDVSTEPALPAFTRRYRSWALRAVAGLAALALVLVTARLVRNARHGRADLVSRANPITAFAPATDTAADATAAVSGGSVMMSDTAAPRPLHGIPASSRQTPGRVRPGSTGSVAAGEVPASGDTVSGSANPSRRGVRVVPVSPGAVALLGERADTVAPIVVAHGDSVARCRSAAAEDQQACLYALINDRQHELSAMYDALSTALRESAGARQGTADPPSVRALQDAQHAWLSARDLRCWRSRGPVPPLWAPERARCLDEETDRRIRELRDQLQQVRHST